MAPLAFLLLMVPGLLAGSVSKLHLQPSPLPAPAPFNPGAPLPGGPLPGGAGAQNPAPLAILPSPAASPAALGPGVGAAMPILLSVSSPGLTVAVAPATSSPRHGKHKAKGHFHPADSDLHGQGS